MSSSDSNVTPLFDDDAIPTDQASATTSVVRRTRPNLDQIQANRQQRLFDEFQALQDQDSWAANSTGFLPSALIQASLPYRDPGAVPVYFKSNGQVALVITPGYGIVQEDVEGAAGSISIPKPVSFGYPYGSIPRLLLAWITTQAISSKRREIQMGHNLSHFMGLLGFHNVSGGENGSIKRLKDQTIRLLSCSMHLNRHQSPGEKSLVSANLKITDFAAIYASDASLRGRDAVFGSTITLAQPFFDDLIANPVPLDFRALKLLRQSPMALDIYAWLTYTMFSLRREVTVSWDSLYQQFGSAGSPRKFRENFRASLVQVQRIYPAARVLDRPQGLLLQPSPTHVPIKRQLF